MTNILNKFAEVGCWLCIGFILVSLSTSEGKLDKDFILDIKQEFDALSEKLREEKIISQLSWGSQNKQRIIYGMPDAPFWHSYRFGTGTGNREVLSVPGVYEDKWLGDGCDGEGVWSWQSLEIGRNEGLLLGLGLESLTLCSYYAPYEIEGQSNRYPGYSATQFKLDVFGLPTAAAIFQTWNDTSKTTDIIAVVALEFNSTLPMLVWYRILVNDRLCILVKLPTTWPLQKSVWDLQSFKIKKERKILVLNHPRENKMETSVDLHGFSWEEEGKTDFWLVQKLTVHASSSVAVVSVGETAYLGISLPNDNLIRIYQFDFADHKFVDFKEVKASGVSKLVSFYVGFSSFIAVAGSEPMLLRYDKEEFVTERIEGVEGLGPVIHWLPVPIRTYRDEVVLLAESESGNRRLVSIVTWTGGHPGFSLHEPTKCNANGKSEQGLWCLLNYDGSTDRLGLQSAAALGVGQWNPGLIIPRSLGPSVLFRLKVQLESVLSPVLKELSLLSKRRKELEAAFNDQEKIILETKNVLSNAPDPAGDNVISGNWEILELKSSHVAIPEIDQDSGVNFAMNDDGFIDWHFGGLQWSLEDVLSVRRINLDSMSDSLKRLSSSVLEFNTEVADAIPLVHDADDPIAITAPQTFVGTIILDGKMIAENLSLEKLNGVLVNEMFDNVVQMGKNKKIGGHKVFKSLKVENLYVEDHIGEISVSSLVFADDKNMNIKGEITYTNNLEVFGDVILQDGGLVNGLDFSTEVAAVNRTCNFELSFIDQVIAKSVSVDQLNNVKITEEYINSLFHGTAGGDNDQIVESTLTIKDIEVLGENLKIDSINGQNFQSLLENLVFINDGGHIAGETTVNNCHALKDVDIKSLNGLMFPSEYVQTSGKRVITGEKRFVHTEDGPSLRVDAIQISGLMDGMNVTDFITLSTDQYLPYTTLNVKIVEIDNLQVVRTIESMPVEDYGNPTLLGESAEIVSDVFFKDVTVMENFIVNGMVDGRSLEETLSAAIYDDEDVTINVSEFEVGNLKARLLMLDGLLNGMDVSGFLSTDTEQTFSGDINVGPGCTFNNITIHDGLINGVNIREFAENSVKLSGGKWNFDMPDLEKVAQKIYGSVTFEEEVIVSPSLMVDRINGFSTSDVGFINLDQEFVGDVVFESLHANSIKVAGSLQAEGSISGVNLKEFDIHRFSLTRPQEIGEGVGVHFSNAHIDGDLLVNSINNVHLDTLDASSLVAPEYSEDISYHIENMIVDGDVITHRIGVFDIDEMKENAIWINKENVIEGPVILEDESTFETLKIEGTFNGYDLNEFFDDLVIQGEDTEITGHKTFISGFSVEDIKAWYLNGNPADDILTMNTEQEITVPIVIKGNVEVLGDFELSRSSEINGINIFPITHRYEWINGAHFIKGDFILRDTSSIDNLNVHGLVNQLEWESYSQSLVYIRDDVELMGDIIFNNKVIFKNNVDVLETVDDVNLQDLFGQFGLALMLEDQGKYRINAENVPVLRFLDDVVIKDAMYVNGDMIANEVYGCDMKEWAEEAIFLDQSQFIKGTKTFNTVSSSGDISIGLLNGVDLGKVILLNRDQVINEELNFTSLYVPRGKDVEVGLLVNGYNLREEFSNTMLVEGDQLISGQKIFLKKIEIEGDMITNETINNVHPTNVITLDTDQDITGLVKAHHFLALADMEVLGLVNERVFAQWVEQGVLKDGPSSVISGKWTVLGNVSFLSEDVSGNGTLDGVDISQLYELTSPTSSTFKSLMSNMKKNLSYVCEDLQYLGGKAISQPFLFHGLEAVQNISPKNDLLSIHHFKVLGEDYLAASYAKECGGELYIWDYMENEFKLIENLAVSLILEWHVIGSVDNDVIVVAKSGGDGDCQHSGYNVWRFFSELQQFKHMQSMEDFKSMKVLQDDSKGGLLYTLGRNGGVARWSLDNDGLLKISWTWNVSGEYLTIVQEKEWKIRVVQEDRKVIELTGVVISDTPEIYTMEDYEVLSISDELLLGAYSVNENTMMEGTADYIKVFNLNDGRFYTKIPAYKPSSLETLNFGYNRQKMLAFLEDSATLKIFEYKGLNGFIEYLSIPVSSLEIMTLSLRARNLFSPHIFILARSQRSIFIFEAVMFGDPIFGDPMFGDQGSMCQNEFFLSTQFLEK